MLPYGTLLPDLTDTTVDRFAKGIMALADIVRDNVCDLFAADAEAVQLDEPWMQARPEKDRQIAVKAIKRMLRDAAGTTVVHLCFGYAIR